MPLVRELNIFSLAIQALLQYGHDLHVNHRFTAAKALASLVETEDFCTHREAFYSQSAGDIDRMIQFKDSFLAEFTSDLEKRKPIRPLLDAIDRAKRMNRTK